MNPVTRFDLEQQMLECWQMVDDVRLLKQEYTTLSTSPEQVVEFLTGLEALYRVKFDRMFRTFETLVQGREFDEK